MAEAVLEYFGDADECHMAIIPLLPACKGDAQENRYP